MRLPGAYSGWTLHVPKTDYHHYVTACLVPSAHGGFYGNSESRGLEFRLGASGGPAVELQKHETRGLVPGRKTFRQAGFYAYRSSRLRYLK